MLPGARCILVPVNIDGVKADPPIESENSLARGPLLVAAAIFRFGDNSFGSLCDEILM